MAIYARDSLRKLQGIKTAGDSYILLVVVHELTKIV